MAVDKAALERIGRELLVAIGENPEREGIRDTPRRWAKWWAEFIDYDAGNIATAFRQESVNQMVVVAGMRVYTLCEHHLLPFWTDISIGYVATDKILGLSKFARIARKYAHRLQVQERLVEQIANEVQKLTGSPHVAVYGQGVHMCMVMRGVEMEGLMTSSVLRGNFYDLPEVRQEFLSLVMQSRGK